MAETDPPSGRPGMGALAPSNRLPSPAVSGSLADPFHLSPPEMMEKIRAAMEAAPDPRPERVELFRRLLEGGSYRVEAEILAERMIREALFGLLRP